jgi:copper chaperone
MTMIQTLIISGMSCQHCVRAVSDALSAVEGVDSVEVDLDAGSAKVDGRAEIAALIAAVVAAGYAAEPLPAA